LIVGRITGGKELDALLKMLPEEVEAKIVRNALNKGANIIRDQAKANIQRRSGATARAIMSSSGVDKGQGLVYSKVKLHKRRKFIGRFLEYGTAAHLIWVSAGKGSLVVNGVAIGKQVLHPGTAPRPFLRPALDTKASEAVQAVAGYLSSYLKFGSITAPVVQVDEIEEAA
jgi:HK97 gp10 family phage protein